MFRIFNFLFIIFFFSVSSSTYADIIENCKYFTNSTGLEKKIISLKIKPNNYRSWQVNNIRILTDNSNIISENYKRKFLSQVTVFYEDDTYCKLDAKIRPHGDLKDHIYFKDGKVYQSLDVHLLNGHINNITKFKLFLSGTRGNNEDEIFMTELLREMGFIAPRTELIEVKVNNLSIKMLFQEKITKELLEYNLKREGPILEGDEKYMWSYVSKIKNKPQSGIDWKEIFKVSELGTRIQLSKQSNSSWAMKESEFLIDSLLALEKLNFAYLVYLNSYNKNLSFLDYDLDNLILSMNDKYQHERLNIFNNLIIAAQGYHALYTHNRRFYWDSINGYFEPIYYDGGFNITEKITKLNFPLSFDYIKSINKTKMQIDQIEKEYFYEDKIKNKLNITYKDYLLKFDILKKNLNDIENLFLSKKNEDLEFNNTSYKSMKLYENYITNIEYLDEDIKFLKFTSNSSNNDFLLCANQINQCDNKIYLNSQEIRQLLEGDLKKKNENYQFIGFKENFENKYNSILLNDEYFDDVTFYFKGDFSYNYKNNNFEIYQNDSLGRSYFAGGKIKNVKIKYIGSNNFFKNQISNRLDYKTLTGCLTFFNTEFDNVEISSNYSNCEDGVNIMNSKGNIEAITASNSLYDGVDFDFSKISINQINIVNSLNDCSDFSGGEYYFNIGNFKNCGDKGISIGEKSVVKINQAEIINSNIGIASKDSSKVIVDTANIINTNECLSAYNKKQEFSGSYLRIKKENCQNFNKKISYDDFSEIEIN